MSAVLNVQQIIISYSYKSFQKIKISQSYPKKRQLKTTSNRQFFLKTSEISTNFLINFIDFHNFTSQIRPDTSNKIEISNNISEKI